jgi:hypothetical protein
MGMVRMSLNDGRDQKWGSQKSEVKMQKQTPQIATHFGGVLLLPFDFKKKGGLVGRPFCRIVKWF